MTAGVSRAFAPPPVPRTRHLDALTGIRGIAAWFVVLFHIRVTLGGLVPAAVIAVMAKGYLAVDLFFILSGFVLWYNYADRLAAGGRDAAITFYARRLARLWPLHAVILAAFVLLALALAATGHDYSAYPFGELPLHIALMQNWGLTRVLSWNDPAWSISCELGAYVAFPLMAVALGRVRWTTGALLALAVALLGGLYALYALAGATMLGHDVTRLGLPRCLFEFTLGNVLCQLWRRWHHARHVALAAGGLGMALLVAGVGLRLPETAFVPALFAAGLMALATGRGVIVRTLGARVPVYLGEISYSTYLAHYLLFVLFKFAVVHGSPALSAAQLGAFAVLVLGASVVLHHGVELPAQAWLNARIRRRTTTPAMAR